MKRKSFRLIPIILVTFICVQFLSAAPTGQRLRTLADTCGFLIGSMAWQDFLIVDDNSYARTLNEEFNFVSSETAMQMDVIEPTQNSFNFSQANQFVTWAQSNGMKVHGHYLVGQNPMPYWAGSIYNKTELTNVMYNHIDKVMTQFKGRIQVWDVVIEAINIDGSYRSTGWLRVIGSNFIDLAFQRARQADPGAKLIYDDYDIEQLGAKSDAVYNMIKSMKDRGIPIDGVGFEMHLTDSGLDYQSFADNMARFAALGLELYITQMDVRLPDSNRDLEKQAAIYREVLNCCLAQPACKALQVWGIVDKYSWCASVYPGTGVPLLFDNNYNAKPAYYAIQEVLTNFISPTPTPTGKKGDVNGDNAITIIDAMRIAQRTSGQNPQGFIERNADVNCDGKISIADALLVAQFSAGLIASLPCN